MNFRILFIVLALTGLVSCKSSQLIHPSTPGNELYKVAILYPNGEGKTFDITYYEEMHMPMVAGFLGDNLKFYEIDKGISGRTPDDEVPYLAVGYFYVRDVSAYNQAIGQNISSIVGDFKNYTNIQPVIQISEVRFIGFNGME